MNETSQKNWNWKDYHIEPWSNTKIKNKDITD